MRMRTEFEFGIVKVAGDWGQDESVLHRLSLSWREGP